MARGFVYLAAVVDWFSRRVLSRRVSITMAVEFCLQAVEEALARHGKPEIFNTDQGSQFTGADFTGLLLDNAIAISMDGKGHGATTSLSSGSGVRSNTKRSICGPEPVLGPAAGRTRGTASAWRAPRSVGIWTSTTASGRIRALTLERRIAPISTTCRRSRQREFSPPLSVLIPVGLRPPCVTHRQRHTTTATGRGSTYPEPKPVQTKPASSIVYC
jgi:hypothetical protein